MIIGDFITLHKMIQLKLIQKIPTNANRTECKLNQNNNMTVTQYVSIYFILFFLMSSQDPLHTKQGLLAFLLDPSFLGICSGK